MEDLRDLMAQNNPAKWKRRNKVRQDFAILCVKPLRAFHELVSRKGRREEIARQDFAILFVKPFCSVRAIISRKGRREGVECVRTLRSLRKPFALFA